MTATQAPPSGDYVPEPGRKKRLSRGRKGLIGVLVVAAAGAAAGGGTFASFTASTDNATAGDDGFTAENPMLLANHVLSNASVLDQCESDNDPAAPGGTVAGAQNAVVCDVLFGDDDIDAMGTGSYQAKVAIENLSTVPGKLILAAPAACSFVTTSLCDNIELSIQEVGESGARSGAGAIADTEAEFDAFTATANNGTDPECVFPTDQAVCGTNTDTLDNLPDFATPVEIEASMEATDNATNAGVRYFLITAKLGNDTSQCDTGEDADEDGINDATGQGCHNGLTGNAEFTLRWVLQEI